MISKDFHLSLMVIKVKSSERNHHVISITNFHQNLPLIMKMLTSRITYQTLRQLSTSKIARVIYQDENIKIETPQKDAKGGFIARNVKYFNDIDNAYNQTKSIPVKTKTNVLLKAIEKQPELLFYLASFHRALKALGIDQSSKNRDHVWKYRLKYMFELGQLHQAFFSTSKVLGLTQHEHSLGFSPKNIGILDPANFSKEDYEALQTGVFKGTDYRHINFWGRHSFG